MTRQLYPYQQEAYDAIHDAWFRRRLQRIAIVVPTGGGKTTIFSRVAHDFFVATGRRVLEVAHRQELIDSAAQRQREESPDLTVGVVKASQNQTLADIVVGSVATLRNPRRLAQLMNVGLIIIDETHHATAASYRAILDAFPDALVLGVTATFSRSDGAGLGQIFQDVVYQVPMSVLQAGGFLVHARGLRVGVPSLDLSKVKTTGGEYQDGALDKALSDSLAPEAIVRAVVEHAPHDSAVVFTPGVHFAQVMHEAFDAAGFTSAWVSGKTPDEERRRILKRVAAGDVQIINNCGVLTEGTDIPRLKTCVLKPTNSEIAYAQMAGRVLRPFPGYTHGLIMDPAGATARFSLNARIELFGADVAEAIEREPCDCWGDPSYTCRCGQRRCTEYCACGGGRAGECGCTRPERAEPEEPDGSGLDEERRADGQLFSVEVDLFHGSRNQWLVTRGGTWFLNAGQRFIALVPGRRIATWSAVAASREAGGGSEYLAGVRDLPDKGYAMAFAEDHVTRQELRYARKDRGWRARPLGPKQLDDARCWGVPVTAETHGGQLADLIAIEQASRRLDEGVEQLRRDQR